jgi:hypothetical protein
MSEIAGRLLRRHGPVSDRCRNDSDFGCQTITDEINTLDRTAGVEHEGAGHCGQRKVEPNVHEDCHEQDSTAVHAPNSNPTCRRSASAASRRRGASRGERPPLLAPRRPNSGSCGARRPQSLAPRSRWTPVAASGRKSRSPLPSTTSAQSWSPRKPRLAVQLLQTELFLRRTRGGQKVFDRASNTEGISVSSRSAVPHVRHCLMPFYRNPISRYGIFPDR